ncbi:MAG: hypothetical protein ACYSR4_05405 [Planctomycetota bacterium]
MRLLKRFSRSGSIRRATVYFLTYCLLVNTSLPMVMAVENPTSTTLPSGVLPGSTISTSDIRCAPGYNTNGSHGNRQLEQF